MKIDGRTFVISGGASGLGHACAQDLIAHGANVAVLDFNEKLGEQVVKELGDDKARFFPCNVRETESIAGAVKGTLDWVSKTGKPLGGIIPAAGVGFPGLIIDRDGSPLDMSNLEVVIGVNLLGTIDLIRQFLPALSKTTPEGADKERGVIVMIASVAAYEGQRGQVAYAASKGGVAAMTLPMARDLSQWGIRVVSVAPGIFTTAMTAGMTDRVRMSIEKSMEFPRRAGVPKELAALVRHIVENVMLNGEVVRLDGGSRMPSKL
ncbi:hypothetical protein Cpir12675_001910 [Ceratocystis pirilliformis]|uniref:3-hydroxyacyl-CoA dehydrogenase type-2 n=1 Tax=Ceratocystis pirilliformis TaxID=259994 RepID=A0ABR3ZE88_9PEZI